MEAQLLFGWLTKDSEGPYSGKVDTGLQGVTGNSNFTGLTDAIVACNTAFGTYSVAKAEAAQGGKENIATRNAARASLTSLLRVLMNNINAAANGNEVILKSSAFPLRSTTRSPIGALPTPEAPTMTQGPTSGTLKASVKGIYGASLYSARLALASSPEVYVQTKQGTSARFVFDSLTTGEIYNVEINAIGTAGATDWSDAGTLMVI